MTLNPNIPIAMPSSEVPSFRTSLAIERGVEKNLLLRTWGGIGDQICAEPTLRFALDTFKGCTISLASEAPEFFSHLKFDRVFDLKDAQPVYDNFLLFDMIKPLTSLVWEFMSHMLVNCVDYPALCAFRCQLPVHYKPIILEPTKADFVKALCELAVQGHVEERKKPYVAIHAGKHWQSKTFPKAWWDTVISSVISLGCKPVLVGGRADDNRSTVDVDTRGCIDLRGRLSLMESVAALQSIPVLLTNDSAPLHMAASGQAWIGFVATCKHPDYIMHWRNGQWAWHMHNFGKGGIWDEVSYCPNAENQISAENVGDALLESWLPDPVEFGSWGAHRARHDTNA